MIASRSRESSRTCARCAMPAPTRRSVRMRGSSTAGRSRYRPRVRARADERPRPQRVRRRRCLLPRRLSDRRGVGRGLRRNRNDTRAKRLGRGTRAARRVTGAQEVLRRVAHRGAHARVVDRARRRVLAHDGRPKGDKYVINGSKCFITTAATPRGTWSTEDGKDAGHRGISSFLVPRDETVTVHKHEDSSRSTFIARQIFQPFWTAVARPPLSRP
jgi:hypothetical protein